MYADLFFDIVWFEIWFLVVLDDIDKVWAILIFTFLDQWPLAAEDNNN